MQQPVSLLKALDAFRHIQSQFNWEQEEVHVIALNSQKEVIATGLLFRGTVDYCMFHPRDIFRFLVKHNASSFILAHNHPSGQPNPSEADIKLTRKIIKISQMMEIEFLDHLVLTQQGFRSMKELDCLKLPRSRGSVIK